MRRKIAASCLLLLFLVGFMNIKTYAKVSDIQKREFANIVLFAHFSGSNVSEDAAYFSEKGNRDKIINYYNGDHGRSMTNYLKKVSYGKFEIHNIFPQDNGAAIQSCQVSVTEKEAQEKNVDSIIIEQVLKKVPGINSSLIDYDGDGYIDNLTIVMKGAPPSDSSSVVSTLVSHKSDFPDSTVTWSGKNIGTYNMLSTDRIMDQQSGVIIHEFLHSLGYPDLYRGNQTDPRETCRYPVFIWDIMASASYRVSYPLAYMRMKYTNWLDIETITESTSLTLDTQDKAEGNQAYILQSPLNEHELFVVEYRKTGRDEKNPLEQDSLDSALLSEENSGVIVYRVNTTVTGLSNYYGQTGIYVFRPQKGQNGYVTTDNGSYNENMTVMNAALSDYNGRTSIGYEDLSKTLADGALTFSDGTNSGIVISNVKSSSGGSQMTLDVSIPEGTDFDLWRDTEFKDISSGNNKNAAVTTVNGIQYLVVYSGGKFQLYKYNGNGWSILGNGSSETRNVIEIKLVSCKNELYLAYIVNGNNIYIKKSNSEGVWKDVVSINNTGSDYDIKEVGGEIYLTYVSNIYSDTKYPPIENSKAILGKISNNEFVSIGEYYNSNTIECGQPRICELDGKIYVSVREALNSVIEISRYEGNKKFTRINDNSITANTYGITSLDGKIYIALGSYNGTNLKMIVYDQKSWNTGKDSGISSIDPNLSVTQGNLYILVSSASREGNTKIYQYDTEEGDYIQEGMDVDTAGQNLSFTSSENKLFVSYVRTLDEKIIVKEKNTANELLSLTIIPPSKISYFKGDKVDSNGISVTANYKKGSRQLAAGTYDIKNFDTNEIGQRIATVSYGGKENIFSYEVMEASEDSQKPTEPGDSEKPVVPTDPEKPVIPEETKKPVNCNHHWKTSIYKATMSKNGSIVTACTICKSEKNRTAIAYPKTITLSNNSYIYNGKKRTPSVIVKNSKGEVINASNYVIYYSKGRKTVGQYTVTITFKGNYSGTVEKTYTITPKGTSVTKITGGKKRFTVKWKKQTKEMSGYQIQYSTKKNFKSSVKTKTITKKKTSANISKLKSKKKYYVRIRTYKTVKVNGKSKKIYSGWSKSKTVKVK